MGALQKKAEPLDDQALVKDGEDLVLFVEDNNIRVDVESLGMGGIHSLVIQALKRAIEIREADARRGQFYVVYLIINMIYL